MDPMDEKGAVEMGLSLCVDGSKNGSDEAEMNIGYGQFYAFRTVVADKYDPAIGRLYTRHLEAEEHRMMCGQDPQNDREYNLLCNEVDSRIPENVWTFLYHSDCSGEWTPEECKSILSWFERLDFTGDVWKEEYDSMLELLKKSVEINQPVKFS
jgi:hypothetical protein